MLRLRYLMVKVTALEVPPPGDGLVTVMLAVPFDAIKALGTIALSWDADTLVVARGVPFQLTVELATNLLPLTVSVNAAPPCVAEVGLIEVMVGAGLLMVKITALEVVPSALTTVTLTVPAVAMSDAGTEAVSLLAELKVVVKAAPFHLTVAPLRKLLPFTVSLNAEPPAVALLGLIEEIVGGLLALVMVKVKALEAPPPGAGLTTVTLAVPGAVTSEAGTLAVNCVLETKVVVRAVPFQLMVASLTKLVPVAVRVNWPLPAAIELGEMLVSVGAGLLMVKVKALEVPPPGAGLTTVTLAVPALAIRLAGTLAVNWVADA